MSLALSHRRFSVLAGLALLAAGLVAYANALTADFVWDDVSSVLQHRHVQDPSKIFQLFREDQHAFGRGEGNFYRPLVSVSFMIDYALARGANPEAAPMDVDPFLFHLTSVLWHVAASILLCAVMVRLDAPRIVAFATALLYAVHPLHTEAVAYVSGRADSMAAAFMFAALLCALVQGDSRRRLIGTVLAGLFFILALLSKESAAIFPFLLLAVMLLRPMPEDSSEESEAPRRDVYLRRMLPVAVTAVIVVIYGLLRLTVLRFGSGGDSTAPGFGVRLVDAGQAFALYIRLIFLPTGLHMERTLDGVPGWAALVGYVLMAGCVALAIYGLRTGRRRVALGMAWFLITWFPISGFIPINAPMAEHWLYVPLAGFLWAMVELVAEPLRRSDSGRRAAAVAVYAVFLLFLGLTLDRNRDWKDNVSLFRATLRENPNSIRVHYNLAVTYDEVVKNNPVGARRHYERVVALIGEPPSDMALEARVSAGDVYFRQRLYDAAAQHYLAVLQAEPSEERLPLIGSAAYGLGRIALLRGDLPGAVGLFGRAQQGRPDLADEIRVALESGARMAVL